MIYDIPHIWVERISAVGRLVIRVKNILLSGILECYMLAGDLGDADGNVQRNGDALE